MTHTSLISRKDIVMIPFEGQLLPTLPRIIIMRSCTFVRNVLQFHLCAIITVNVSHKIATITLNNCINKTGHHSVDRAVCPLVK